ncbi:hypothetical protein ACFL27_15810 [candidate division CSSED10-310 bacterium]|uniref:Outer membrane protein beta-barrel domain-containing protein n=1 Tax=candidate division CSSED10-310 bacterium TaxID=2855610 RepID=A0ABV6Z000_UNCC1
MRAQVKKFIVLGFILSVSAVSSAEFSIGVQYWVCRLDLNHDLYDSQALATADGVFTPFFSVAVTKDFTLIGRVTVGNFYTRDEDYAHRGSLIQGKAHDREVNLAVSYPCHSIITAQVNFSYRDFEFFRNYWTYDYVNTTYNHYELEARTAAFGVGAGVEIISPRQFFWVKPFLNLGLSLLWSSCELQEENLWEMTHNNTAGKRTIQDIEESELYPALACEVGFRQNSATFPLSLELTFAVNQTYPSEENSFSEFYYGPQFKLRWTFGKN